MATHKSDGSGLSIDQTLAVNVPAEKKVHLIDQRRWVAFRNRIENLSGLEKNFSSAAWACIGVAFSGAVAIATWVPAYEALPVDERADFTWVWVVLCGVSAVGLAAGGALFVANRGVKGAKRQSVEDVLEEMDLLPEK